MEQEKELATKSSMGQEEYFIRGNKTWEVPEVKRDCGNPLIKRKLTWLESIMGKCGRDRRVSHGRGH